MSQVFKRLDVMDIVILRLQGTLFFALAQMASEYKRKGTHGVGLRSCQRV